MYYNYIIFKFIRVVYIIINNKNNVRYEYSLENLDGELSLVTLKKL